MNIDDLEFRDMVSDARTRFDIWKQLLNTINANTIIEIGVWEGDFAKEILEQCEFIERYYMVDPWDLLNDWNKPCNINKKLIHNAYTKAMKKTAFASNKVVVLRGRTKDVIDEIPDESLDFAYIDGDHTLKGITIDLIKIFPKIKKNGYIAGDDFTPNVWEHGPNFEPSLVCPYSVYFAEAMDLPFIALPFKQFLIQKNPDLSYSFVDYTGKYNDISLTTLLKNKKKEVTVFHKDRSGKFKPIN